MDTPPAPPPGGQGPLDPAKLLTPAHLADLRKSGLSDATVAAAGLCSCSEPALLSRLLRYKGRRPAAALGSCLLIPFREPDGTPMRHADLDGQPIDYVRVKPEHPPIYTDEATGKERAAKYLTAKGAPVRVYFPPGLPPELTDPAAGRTLGEGDPLILTEGEKKSLKAVQEGFPTLGLTGVWCFAKPRPKGKGGKKAGRMELCDDLRRVAWRGRPVVIAFDSDAGTKAEVRKAETRLAGLLEAAGASVRVLRLNPLPDGGKCGIDDFLTEFGPEAFRHALAAAGPPEEPDAAAGIDAAALERLVDTLNPERLATLYRRQYEREVGREHVRRLAHHLGRYFAWSGGAYRCLPDARVAADLTRVAECEARKDHERRVLAWRDGGGDGPPPKPDPVTTRLVANVENSLRAAVILDESRAAPCWLTDAPGRPGAGDVIPTTAGVIVPATGELLPATPELFVTAACPHYRPDAPPPARWLAFLAEVFPGDPESAGALQEFAGLLLTGDTSQQKCLVLIGPPRAGKGVIQRVLAALVGPDAHAATDFQTLCHDHGAASLVGKTLATMGDLRVGPRADLSVGLQRLLCVIGEDPVPVNPKNKPVFTAALGVRFVINANELPAVADSARAFAARAVVLKFTRDFRGREDPALFDRLRAELPGVFGWALAGLRRLRERGRLVQPAAGAKTLADLDEALSPVTRFVRERCVVVPSAAVPKRVLFDAWFAWCRAEHVPGAGTPHGFGAKLGHAVTGLAEDKRRVDGRRVERYLGVRLRTRDDRDGVDDSDSDDGVAHDGGPPGPPGPPEVNSPTPCSDSHQTNPHGEDNYPPPRRTGASTPEGGGNGDEGDQGDRGRPAMPRKRRYTDGHRAPAVHPGGGA